MKIKIAIIIVSLVSAAFIAYDTFYIKTTHSYPCYNLVSSGWPFKSEKEVDYNNVLCGYPFPQGDVSMVIFAFNMLVYFVFVFLISCCIFHRQIRHLKPYIFLTISLAVIGIPIAVFLINLLMPLNMGDI